MVKSTLLTKQELVDGLKSAKSSKEQTLAARLLKQYDLPAEVKAHHDVASAESADHGDLLARKASSTPSVDPSSRVKKADLDNEERTETNEVKSSIEVEELTVIQKKDTTDVFGLVIWWVESFMHLFFYQRKFRSHRLIGFSFLVQYVFMVMLYVTNYNRYLQSVLLWSTPLTGLVQALNASKLFRHLPRREDPGFAAVSDKSALSYYVVRENSFYALHLVFMVLYLHPKARPYSYSSRYCSSSNMTASSLGIGDADDSSTAVPAASVSPFSFLTSSSSLSPTVMIQYGIEPLFVFFIFYIRNRLWPSSRISAALANSQRNKSKENLWILTVSTYLIKLFYILAKHSMIFFVGYLIFLGRIGDEARRNLYGIQCLGGYASTISIFIHTLKFRGYLSPLKAMVAYDIIIPFYALLFWNIRHLFSENLDVLLVATGGMLANLVRWKGVLRPRLVFHVYQFAVACVFYDVGGMGMRAWVLRGGGVGTSASASEGTGFSCE